MWLLLAPTWTAAASIERLQVEREAASYRLDLQAHIAAPLPAVWAALTDYPGLHRLAPAILESEVLDPTADGVARVRTLSHVCVWIFCKDLKHVQHMQAPRMGELDAHSEAALSDFESGHVRWLLSAENGVTRMEMRAEITPAFWVPPVIGPYLVQQGLSSTALEILQGLEQRAGGRSQ